MGNKSKTTDRDPGVAPALQAGGLAAGLGSLFAGLSFLPGFDLFPEEYRTPAVLSCSCSSCCCCILVVMIVVYMSTQSG